MTSDLWWESLPLLPERNGNVPPAPAGDTVTHLLYTHLLFNDLIKSIMPLGCRVDTTFFYIKTAPAHWGNQLLRIACLSCRKGHKRCRIFFDLPCLVNLDAIQLLANRKVSHCVCAPGKQNVLKMWCP